jgi:hypothetical protein
MGKVCRAVWDAAKQKVKDYIDWRDRTADKMDATIYGISEEAAREHIRPLRRDAINQITAADAAVGVGGLANLGSRKGLTLASKADELGDAVLATQSVPRLRFPSDPNQLTKQLGVKPKITTTPDGTVRMRWEPNANTRIRYESHPHGLKPGDPGFNPRHHGPHYHIETKPDGISWNKAKKTDQITKSKPDGYTPGSGTGFVPDEPYPGQ